MQIQQALDILQLRYNAWNYYTYETAVNVSSWLNNAANNLETKNKNYHWAARHFGKESSTDMIRRLDKPRITHTQILY